MFDVGGGELLLIVVAILVLFGPKKIPEVASMIGKGMRKVRQAQDEFTQHMRDLSTDLEHVGESARPMAGSLQPNLNPVDSLPEAVVVASSDAGYSLSANVQTDKISDLTADTESRVSTAPHNILHQPTSFHGLEQTSEVDNNPSESSNDAEAQLPPEPTAPTIRIQPPSGSITR